jgi:hypothetical protein
VRYVVAVHVPELCPGAAVKHTARTLLDRLTRKEISIEEFLRLANQLPDRELELLSELLRQRRMKDRRDEEAG